LSFVIVDSFKRTAALQKLVPDNKIRKFGEKNPKIWEKISIFWILLAGTRYTTMTKDNAKTSRLTIISTTIMSREDAARSAKVKTNHVHILHV
jgi:hypothetical protein